MDAPLILLVIGLALAGVIVLVLALRPRRADLYLPREVNLGLDGALPEPGEPRGGEPATIELTARETGRTRGAPPRG